MKNEVVIAALRQALDADRRNGALWMHLAGLQREDGLLDDAIAGVRVAAELPDSRDAARSLLVSLLREAGQFDEALLRVESLLEEPGGGDEARAALQKEMGLIQEARGQAEEASEIEDDLAGGQLLAAAQGPGSAGAEDQSLADWAEQFDWGDLRITLDDVVGLKDVKRQINLRIIAPYKQPEIYEAFGRQGGGGILLYGPPGCGKTYIARATAGELGARFISVSIHDVLDKYYGESEKKIHALFEEARRNSPTVLFFDEFDALGASRGGADSTFWKSLVDQLLHEMDGVDGQNKDLLMFGATNMPWSVDMAFRRPGRFDRVLFVPPPDAKGRAELLQRGLDALPGKAAIKLKPIVKATEHYTGADLVALSQRAAESALDESLISGEVKPVTQADFVQAVQDTAPSSIEWFATARNYGRYSNEGGQYDDLVAYLKRIKKW